MVTAIKYFSLLSFLLCNWCLKVLSVHPFDFGTNLTSLHKKQVGIWPIAVSCTLCCLTAKVAGSLVMMEMGTSWPLDSYDLVSAFVSTLTLSVDILGF